MSTPFMSLDLPTVSVTLGPTWASMLNTALTSVDSHDHTTGKGVQVPTAGININADLTYNSVYKATNVKAVGLTSQGSTLSDQGVISNVGGNLYWNNGSGVAVQITSGTGLNFSSLGAIGGDYGSPGVNASVSYSNTIKTFTFNQDSNKPAKMAFGDIILGETITSPNTITIKSPTSLGSSYIQTLPTGNPASTKLLQIDSSGAQSYADVDGSTLQNSSGTLSVKDNGITLPKISARTVQSDRDKYTGQTSVTITIASPGVVTKTSHGYSNNDEIVFTTDGSLPTGITKGTAYYVKNATTNTFEISTTAGGSSVNTSGAQSGTHYCVKVIQCSTGEVFFLNPANLLTNSASSTTETLANYFIFAARVAGKRLRINYSFRSSSWPSGISCASTSTASGVTYGFLFNLYRNSSSIKAISPIFYKEPTAASTTSNSYTQPDITLEEYTLSAGVYLYEAKIAYGSVNTGSASINNYHLTVRED